MVPKRILDKYQVAHDKHLDNAAIARRYDSIHTAALRAGYPGPYHDEGKALAIWMDECNEIGYEIVRKINAGEIPPMSRDEYIALLPEFVYP